MEWGKQKFKTEILLHCKKARLGAPYIGVGIKIFITCTHKFYSNVTLSHLRSVFLLSHVWREEEKFTEELSKIFLDFTHKESIRVTLLQYKDVTVSAAVRYWLILQNQLESFYQILDNYLRDFTCIFLKRYDYFFLIKVSICTLCLILSLVTAGSMSL